MEGDRARYLAMRIQGHICEPPRGNDDYAGGSIVSA